MRLSDRVTAAGTVNEITRVANELRAGGVALANLSDSNPTRHGLTDPAVLAVVEDHVRDAARYDPQPKGSLAARKALAARFGGRADDYWLTSSTSQAYAWLTALVADPGDALAVPAPGYPLIPPIARLAGAGTVDYRSHYVHPHGWIVDRVCLDRAAADPRTRALVVVNPGNPTGAYLTGAVDDIVTACLRGDCALVSDEVFAPFAMDGAPMTLAGEDRVVTFVLGGLSKLLCAPQVKLAWIRLSGPADELPPIRDALDTIADAFLPVSAPIAAALPDLLALADASVAATRARLAGNLAALRDLVASGPYRVRRAEGGWTAILDVPPLLDSQDLVIHLLRRAHLAVHPGWFYDLADEGALALSLLPEPAAFAANVHRLRVCLDAIAAPTR